MYTQAGMLNQTKQKDITLKLYKCVFGLCVWHFAAIVCLHLCP